MKELTIEQKAQRYDEAIEEAKKIHEYSSDLAEIKRMEQIFHELKESEGEKIRKELIHYFTEGIEFLSYCSVSREQILAWLEEQGEQKLAESGYMYKQDYKIVISADINEEIYWQMFKKGESIFPTENEKVLMKEMIDSVKHKML